MIYTGYYAKLNKYNEAGIEPVAISGKVPDFYEGFCYPDFAPRWETFKKWKNKEITNEGYVEDYRAYLESLDKSEIITDIMILFFPRCCLLYSCSFDILSSRDVLSFITSTILLITLFFIISPFLF